MWKTYVVNWRSFSYCVISDVHESVEGFIVVDANEVIQAVGDDTELSEISW